MKKPKQKSKKRKRTKKTHPVPKRVVDVNLDEKSSPRQHEQGKSARIAPKKAIEKKGEGRSALRFFGKAGQFLREAKIELKKVKWPTRKELLASTTVVIVLTLIIAFYLGLVDFGLIKAIKYIIG